MSVWSDGRAVPDDQAPHALDRGLLLGDGLFETVLVLDGAPRHLDQHIARMTASAAALGMPVPDSLDALVRQSVGPLWIAEERAGRAALRVTLTRGRGRGLEPSGSSALWISLSALAPLPPGEPSPEVTVVVVDAPRVDPRSPLSGHKTVSALPWVEARRRARSAGAAVALVTTVDGDVCEADAANLFVVLDGRVVTPGRDRGVLPGVTRARCLRALAEAGEPAGERAVSRDDLEEASEIFLTSSLVGVQPVCGLGAHQVPAPGPVAVWLAACLESMEM